MNQKGFAPVLAVLILLIVGIGVAVFLSQKPQIFNPKAVDDGNTCLVTDTTSLKTCFAIAETDEALRQIEIAKQIVCSSKSDCEVAIKKRNNPLLIFGTPGSNAGFKRIQNYDYPLILLGEWDQTKPINEVNNITLKDLIFDETTAECDFVKESIDKCNSPLVLASRVNDSTIDHVTVLHAKAHGIQVSNATRLTIKNSIIFDSEGDGLWFDSAYPAGQNCTPDFYNYTPCPIDETRVNRAITIENNLFADNHVSAIEFYAYPDGQTPSRIKGNLITHNHKDSKYKACPPPDGHCPGGQLAIARSKSVIVEDNVIRDGHINTIDPAKGITFEAQGLLASGIELADTLQDITIKNNKIYDNGTGLFADYIGLQYKIDSVNIIWNVVYNNKYSFVGPGIWNLDTSNSPGFNFAENKVNNPEYPLKITKAFIFADPPVCESAGDSDCRTTVHWYTNDSGNTNIGVEENPGSLFASGPNGSQVATWIKTMGATFQLKDSSNNVLATTKAVKSGSLQNSPSVSPSASPSPSGTQIRRPSFQLSANPNPCILVGSNECSSTISWRYSVVGAYPQGDAWIQIKENPGSKFATLAYGTNGSQVAPWIKESGATFQVVEGGVVTSELFVKGIPQNGGTLPSPSPSPVIAGKALYAEPNPCRLNEIGMCAATVYWNFPGKTDVKITVRENPGSLFASGPAGSQLAPWISNSGATFDAYSGQTLLASITVKGENPSTIGSPSLALLGDLNNDGKVNIMDIGIFIDDYKNGNLRSDLNKDGKVSVLDFNLLLSQYGKSA